MDVKDNNTKERLLTIAKREFLRYGFRKVSMRDISKATGMALGNIYYYYKTKDELFSNILSPVLREFDEIIKNHDKMESMDLNKNINENTWHFYGLIKKNRRELYLLFYMSQGSSLEEYSDHLIRQFTDMGMRYVDNYKKYHKKEDIHIDPFFMHVYSAMILTSIKEIIRNEHIPRETFSRFSRDILEFTTNGWKSLMRV